MRIYVRVYMSSSYFALRSSPPEIFPLASRLLSEQASDPPSVSRVLRVLELTPLRRGRTERYRFCPGASRDWIIRPVRDAECTPFVTREFTPTFIPDATLRSETRVELRDCYFVSRRRFIPALGFRLFSRCPLRACQLVYPSLSFSLSLRLNSRLFQHEDPKYFPRLRKPPHRVD